MNSLLPEFPSMADSAFAAFPDVARLRNDDDSARLTRLATCLVNPRERALRRAELAAVTEAAMLSAPDLPLWPVFEIALAERGDDISGASRVLQGAGYYAELIRRSGVISDDAHFFADMATSIVTRYIEDTDMRHHSMIRPLLKHYMTVCYDMPPAAEHIRYIAALIDTEQHSSFAHACMTATMRISDDTAKHCRIDDALDTLRRRIYSVLYHTLPSISEEEPLSDEHTALSLFRRYAKHLRLAMMLHRLDDILCMSKRLADICEYLVTHTRQSPVLWRWLTARIAMIRVYYHGDRELRAYALHIAESLSQDSCIKDFYRHKAKRLVDALDHPHSLLTAQPILQDSPFSFTDAVRGFDALNHSIAKKNAELCLSNAISYIRKNAQRRPIKGHVILCGSLTADALCAAAPLMVTAEKDGYQTSTITDIPSLKQLIHETELPILLLTTDESSEMIDVTSTYVENFPHIRAYSMYLRTDSHTEQEGAERFDAASIACYPPGKPFAMPDTYCRHIDITQEKPRLASVAARRFAITLSALKEENHKLIYIRAENTNKGRAWMLSLCEAARSRGLVPLRPAFKDESSRSFAEMTRLGTISVPDGLISADIASFLYAAFIKHDISVAPEFTAANVPVFWCGSVEATGGMNPCLYRTANDKDVMDDILPHISSLTLPDPVDRDAAKRYCIARERGDDAIFIRGYAGVPIMPGCRAPKIYSQALSRLAMEGNARISTYVRLLMH